MSLQARSIAPPLIPVSAPSPATRATSCPGSTVVYALVSTRAEFNGLEAEWNALFERAGKPTQVFQTFNWNWHWANHYLASSPGGVAGVKLSIVTARRDGRLIMVWPLVSEHVRGITQLFWMGDPASQYGDLIIDDVPDALAVMRGGWEHLAANAKGDLMRLRRIRDDASIAPLMADIGASIADRLIAPYIDLASAPSFAKYEERYSSHARKNRRRLMRRLEERGAVTFERHHGGPDARRLAVKALELKADWLRSRGLISQAISDARLARFFADAAGGEDKSTNCIVTSLNLDGEPAALEVTFFCKGRLVMHVIVYNLKFEKAGVGVLLMEKGLSDGYAENICVCDLLAPGDAYKLDWADGSAGVCDWVKPLNLTGLAYARLYLGFIRPKAKAAMAAMPQYLRKLIKRAANG
jgi:CelD/BcsL family acetyltransferase involved in cellulose biosynthesis